ncbi:MAG: rhomboid family intramembrane serine protease [Candidatus Nealsonbacteria bacterium CG_4_9_14_0_8_um_filter_35_12]|uniref:Rhomboid family intramembrane serine protease n=1 Tax=Candidatus Nealsonbacteria bacterium CG_4_9_14_0_8_um_filter_35_12 TaxID=1974692 RepID=A0A2M8DNN9_9BACT|nr:MAG: rhomboid family intramembrane serine protease [Candidatus Nealsonbacteria bacterium CG_4_9_14_0_8_um_filter_35_12]
MFPLYDESFPSRKLPYITIFLILLNVFIFIFTYLSPNFEEMVFEYGAVPKRILEGEGVLTLISSMFLHGGFLHLISNMWFLWLFGDNVEQNLGKIKFLIFYLLCGILAGLFHIFLVSVEESMLPVIGASGAISGVLGGYLILYPKNKIRAFFMLYFRPIIFSVPAYFYIGIWFLYQFLSVGVPSPVAYFAHIGGFIAGMILVLFLRRKIIRKSYSEI